MSTHCLICGTPLNPYAEAFYCPKHADQVRRQGSNPPPKTETPPFITWSGGATRRDDEPTRTDPTRRP